MSKKMKRYCIIGRAVEVLVGCSLMAGIWLVILFIAFWG